MLNELSIEKWRLFGPGWEHVVDTPSHPLDSAAMIWVDDAQTKVDGVRRWAREYENRVSPLARHIDQVRHTLVVDMAKAVASLQQSLASLHDYAGISASKPSPPPESAS